jgi:Mrp family chromosome partitioning ATPase
MLASPEILPAHHLPDLSGQLDAVLPALAAGRPLQHVARRVVIASAGSLDFSQQLAADVARTCALRGYRTLAIDTNLHDPMLHEILGTPNLRGLSNLLGNHSESPHRLIEPTGVPNLAIIPAGPPPPNGSSLLSSEDVFHRVEPIARRFDFLVADCTRLPPVLAASIGERADSIVLLTRRHKTPLRQLSKFVELMRAKGTVQPSILLVD